MNQTRKVVTMDGNGRIWTEEQEIPEPRAGQLVVEVRASMISPGTELGGVKTRRANPTLNPNVRSVIATPALSSTKEGIVVNLKSETACRAWGVDTPCTQRTPVCRTISARRFLTM